MYGIHPVPLHAGHLEGRSAPFALPLPPHVVQRRILSINSFVPLPRQTGQRLEFGLKGTGVPILPCPLQNAQGRVTTNEFTEPPLENNYITNVLFKYFHFILLKTRMIEN